MAMMFISTGVYGCFLKWDEMGLFIGFSMTMEPSSYGDTPTMASACPAWAARIKGDQPCASTWSVGFGAWGVDGMLNGEMLDDFRDMLGIF